MSLKHAILGFLSVESMNGYQLKKHCDESISKFWSVSISQIYPTLSSMLESKVIDIKDDNEDSSRGSKIYIITEKGREELNQWLSKPTEEEPFRSEMLLKLYFGSNVDPEVFIKHFSQLKSTAQQRIEFYESSIKHIESHHTDEQTFEKDAVYWKMTVQFGIFRNQSLMQWCDECIETLKKYKAMF